MKRWALPIVLLLSLGINLGILAALAAGRYGGRVASPADAAGEPADPAPAPAAAVPAAEPASPPSASPQPPAAGRPSEVPVRTPEPVPDTRPEAAAPAVEPPSEEIGPAVDDLALPDTEPGEPPRGPGPRFPPGAARLAEMAPRLERLADHLGLAGPERERFLALQRGMFEAIVAGQRRRIEAEARLRRELVAAEPDRARIDDAIRRAADAHVAIETATADAILATRALLDPEQERRYLAVLAHLRPRLLGPGGGAGLRPGAGPPRRRRPPLGERLQRPPGG